MQAIVYRENGSPDVLRCEEIDKPTPGPDEVLIKVHAASVNPLDWRMMRGSPLFRVMSLGRKPKLSHPGVDVAGVVEVVGSNVTQFKPGDEVFGAGKGTFAEYAGATAGTLAIKPAGVTFEQAAALPVAGITALQALRDHGGIQRGHKVLINGAAGGVGTFAVQIAKHFGAEVAAVCSARNADLVRRLGADRVIDYAGDNFTRNGDRYDIILDNIGNHSLGDCRRILTPKGRCVIIGGPKQISRLLVHAAGAFVLSWFVSQRLGLMVAKVTTKDLTLLADFVQTGKVRPVLDLSYSLREVPEAVRYLETEHVRGKVVIVVVGASTRVQASA